MEKTIDIRNEVMSISRSFFNTLDNHDNPDSINWYMDKLRDLECKAKSCPVGPKKDDVLSLIQRTLKKKYEHLQMVYSR